MQADPSTYRRDDTQITINPDDLKTNLFTQTDTFPTTYDQFGGMHGWFEEGSGFFHLQQACAYCTIIPTTSANPNPRTSCSSCVALYRNCSFTHEPKRPMSRYETDLPGMDNLHGLFELEETDEAQGFARNTKKESARVTNRTKVLREWTDKHQKLYPTDEERAGLVQRSGLTERQVRDWFSNLRRKQRRLRGVKGSNRAHGTFRSGSPMPQPLTMDRWRNSPPEEESVSLQTLENAAMTFIPGNDSDSLMLHREGSSSSISSSFSDFSASSYTSTRSVSKYTFYCTFCSASFSRRPDWMRHEKSKHVSLDFYFCCIESETLAWEIEQPDPCCAICGDGSPGKVHLEQHEISACVQRSSQDRTFTRSDHLMQHLVKFHHVKNWHGCDWRSRCRSWRHKVDNVQSSCGFCLEMFSSWTKRCDHVAEHFKEGLTMMEWIGQPGLNIPP